MTGVLVLLGDLLQDPAKESPQEDKEDKEEDDVVTLDVIQHTGNGHEEGPTRGEDWEEVRSIHRNLLPEESLLLGITSPPRPPSRPPSPVSQVSSQASSVSSCDDYIILPDCFDTSRPLGESTHAAVTSADDPREEEDEMEEEEMGEDEMGEDDPTSTAQRGGEEQREEEEAESSENTWPPAGPPGSVNQLLCTSQTLDTVTLTPEVAPAPALPPAPPLSPPALYSPR